MTRYPLLEAMSNLATGTHKIKSRFIPKGPKNMRMKMMKVPPKEWPGAARITSGSPRSMVQIPGLGN